jgi:hypothetical protein
MVGIWDFSEDAGFKKEFGKSLPPDSHYASQGRPMRPLEFVGTRRRNENI